MRAFRIIGACCASLALVAGCGGGDDGAGSPDRGPVEIGSAPRPGAEQQVASAVIRWAAGGDTTAKCGRVFTVRLVTEIYGGVGRCRATVDGSATAQLRDAKVGDVAIAGRTATARLSSTAAGLRVAGGMRLVRQAGTWRIDDFDDDLLRSLVSEFAALDVREQATGGDAIPGAGRLVDDIGLAGCIAEGLDDLPGAQRRRSLVSSLGAGDRSRRIGRIAAACVGGSASGRRLQRLSFERNLAGLLPEQGRACVVAALREAAGDDLVSAVSGQAISGVPVPAKERALQEALRAAAAGCGVTLRRGPGTT